jgi:nucleosome binding factor SPN SPT16 subunit
VKLQVPDTAANRAKMKVQKGLQYISELTYRTATTSLDKPFFEIDQMRKNWLNRVKELEVKQSLVIQDELKLDRKGPPPMLKDVSVRPHLSRKKTTGTLSAHLNGLRFVTTDKIKVDVSEINKSTSNTIHIRDFPLWLQFEPSNSS